MMKRPGLIFLGAALALWGIGMRRVDAARDACEARMLARQRDLAFLQRTIPDDLELASQADRVQRDADSLDALLPPESAMDQTLKDLCQLAAANSLGLATIKRDVGREIDGYPDSPIDLTVNGDFNGFYSFLLQLESLPRLKRITHLQICSGAAQDGDVQASITLDVFSAPTMSAVAAAQ